MYIDKFDQIISQNITNLNIFNKYLKNTQKIIIAELPDYKSSLELYETKNDNIVIGVIGDISEIKGRQFIIELNEYIKNNKICYVGAWWSPLNPVGVLIYVSQMWFKN